MITLESLFTLLIYVYVGITSSCNAADPKGHLQPLGSHLDKLLSVDTVYDVPYPYDFFNNYVKKSKPLLLKGAAKFFPSFHTWNNDTYLAKKYGKWRIVAEEGKKENRDLGVKYYTFRKFLSVYKEEDIFLVQDILPVNPMSEEVCMLKCTQCGGFTKNVNTVVMWFSSGGTKSLLHRDGYENLNCLMAGTKNLILIDPKFSDQVPIDHEEGAYSSLDVEKVDLYKFPTLKNMPMYLVEIKAGDCIYIPYKWVHQVNSGSTRNMAINVWWSYMHSLDDMSNCPNDLTKLPDCLPIKEIKFADPSEIYRGEMLSLFEDGKDRISLAEYSDTLSASVDGDAIEKIIKIMDINQDGYIVPQEVKDLPLKYVQELFGEGKPIEHQGYIGDGSVTSKLAPHIDIKYEL